MTPQEKYIYVCEQVRVLEKLIILDEKNIKCENILGKVNKLLDDEYRYGSSSYDLKCLFKYINKLSSLIYS